MDKNESEFFTVGVNETWSKDPITLAQCASKGFSTKPSRSAGDFQMWLDGRMVGWLFSSINEQVDFLKQRGLIGHA